MIRKDKSFSRPKKAYEARRIADENNLLKQYGLKNKHEVWKTLAKVDYFRKRAMDLAKASQEEQKVFFNKLKSLGLKAETTADVLDLQIDDLLRRRLPTVLLKKNIATKINQARQMVVHKRILIDGKVVNSPSYLVHVSEENLISVKKKVKAPKQEAKENVEVAQE